MAGADRERWDRRYGERGRATRDPDPFLVALDPLLPRAGRALDVGGGSGRHAIWLARRGLAVTVVDVSPVGLDLAREDARALGLALTLVEADLTRDPLPRGPWDLLVDFHFLFRPLFPAFARALAPGGLLVFCQPTTKNLERHERPPAGFLLEEGELSSLLSGLEVLRYEQGWTESGRHEARLFARRPRPGAAGISGGDGGVAKD